MNKVRFFLVAGLVMLANFGSAQNRPAHELHSMMIYNFLKYIEWPGDKNSGDFVVGVIDSDPVYNTLNAWYGNKTRGNKKFIVKKASASDDLSQFQLVYLGKSGSDKFDGILGKIGNKPVLTVTEKNGLGKKGSCINFRVVDNRLKFELNPAAIEKSSLKTSSQLTNMAIVL